MRDLERDWRSAVRSAGATAGDGDVARAGDRLLRRWREPHRSYHGVQHLTEVLDAVDRLADAAQDSAAVRLAAWFHDAVYDGRPGDDEEASAVLAGEVLSGLGVPRPRVDEVARLVRLTATHEVATGDRNGEVLSDADLAVLAADPDRYARYSSGVQSEYAHVPVEAFRAGRAAVLRQLSGSPLFRTPQGRQLWDATARVNLARELAELEG